MASIVCDDILSELPYDIRLNLSATALLLLMPHQNQLKKVHVTCRRNYLQKIEIKARNLVEFHLFNKSAKLEVDLCVCTKLQVLNLDSAYIPSVKSLSLPLCKGLNKIRIMSLVLKTPSLIDLDDALVVNPNLRWFKIFNSFTFQNTCALDCSKLMEVKIGLKNNRAIICFNDMLPLETDTTESKEVISHFGNLQSKVEPLRIKNINVEILMSWIPRYESLIDEILVSRNVMTSFFHFNIYLSSILHFSNLPNDIGLKILYCLNLKERATACVVSRNWHDMITSLDDHKFVQTHSANKYCRYCYRDKLASCRNCHTLRPIIVKLASDNTTITEFYLLVPITLLYFPFSLEVFESRLLTVLHLKYCHIDENDIKNIFPCLKEMYFDHVAIYSSTLSNFINKCPSIVELTLMSAFIPSQCLIKINLKREIEIKARNLLEFHLFNSSAELEVDFYFYPRTLLVGVNSDAPKYNNFTQVLLDELKNWKRKSESSKRCKHSTSIRETPRPQAIFGQFTGILCVDNIQAEVTVKLPSLDWDQSCDHELSLIGKLIQHNVPVLSFIVEDHFNHDITDTNTRNGITLDDRKLYKHVRLEFCGKYFSNLPVIVKLAADNTILTEFYLFVPTSSAFFKFSPEDFESRLLTVLYLIYCSIDEDDNCFYLYSILVSPNVNCCSRYKRMIEIKVRNLLEFHLFDSPAELEVYLSA
ncbi:hypothetical protein H5410_025805 [Solanum commersonii]|uniref:F-box domain-containing protein n=1 Tax=Solanum commersonii TaxID=4109 RepID=A0A9J5YUS3_SOLCO|nr:hypothetical protein H5410_025805 [Solanum commersonii]